MADIPWRPLLAQAVLTFIATSGVLQITALHNGLEGLAWPVGLRHKRLGYFLASLLLLLSLLGSIPLVRSDAVLSPLFAVAAFLAGSGPALAMHILGAALRLFWGKRRTQPLLTGRLINLGPVQATFYQPAGRGPVPALCLLPDPVVPGNDLRMLTRALVESHIAVLTLDWRTVDSPDRLTLQGLVAVGISHLTRWPGIDGKRVALLGVGLGGDLAFRGAAADTGVVAALAIEPVLSPRRPGLGVTGLRDLSWFEAHRRARAWRRSTLMKELDALTAIAAVGKRPLAIVTSLTGSGKGVNSLDILYVPRGCPLAPAAHPESVGQAVVWLKEHLT